MTLSRTTLGIGVVAGIVVLAVLWYLFRPELLFVNTTVDEAAPVAVAPAATGAPAAVSEDSAAPTAANVDAAAPAVVPASDALVWSGNFQSLAHETRGTAQVLMLADGSRVLRLEDFATSNGPDVRVYLVRGSDGTQDDAIRQGAFVDLGALKGNIGSQNYSIPAEIDLAAYQSVSIWCRRFGVNFGATALPAAS